MELTQWHIFLKENGGKGHTREELKQKYLKSKGVKTTKTTTKSVGRPSKNNCVSRIRKGEKACSTDNKVCDRKTKYCREAKKRGRKTTKKE